MAAFDEYSKRYRSIHMRREAGILEIRLHSDEGPLRFSLAPHGEMVRAFTEIAQDSENEVVILTGTGDEFIGPVIPPLGLSHRREIHGDPIYWEQGSLIANLLNIPVPMIAAVNGPAVRHAEVALLCDIVLAAEEATFQDSSHFSAGLVPGDGVHVVFPMLMGANRGRYFLLTGQTLSAREAKDYGLISEVLPAANLLARAWEHAREIMRRPPLVRRYSRILLTQDLKKRMQDLLGLGLSLESLAGMMRPPRSSG